MPVKVLLGKTCPLKMMNNYIIQQSVQASEVNSLIRIFYLADFTICNFYGSIAKDVQFIAIAIIL